MKKVIAIICAVIVLSATFFAIISFNEDRQDFTVSIDPDEVERAELRFSRVSNALTMDKDREDLISLITALNGKYSLYDKIDVPDTDGGYIAYSILFFDYDGNEICRYSVGYKADLLYIYHEKSLLETAKYYRYRNTEHDLDFPFDDFFNY